MLLGEWFRRAGPGGTLLALLAGCMLMSVVGMCYAELAARVPRAGGEFLYALEGLGPRSAFLVGWSLTLFLSAISAFEGTALGWLIELLIPGIGGRIVYTVLGQPVSAGDILLGLIGTAAICAINLAGVRVAVSFHRFITFGFLAFMGVLIIAGIAFGDGRNLAQPFTMPEGGSWVGGFIWILGTCTMLLYGFQVALYVIEERALGVTIGAATFAMVLGIVGAAVFYAAIAFSAARLVFWQTLLHAELPAVKAFDSLYAGGLVGKSVLVVAALSVAKTWNGVMLMASRTILAQARAGFIPAIFRHVDPLRRTPSRAIWLVTGATSVGILFGRGGLIPVINTATICIATTIALMLVILLRIRAREGESPGFAVPGGSLTIFLALLGSGSIAAFSIVQPLWHERGVPLEWKIIGTWMLLGSALSLLRLRRHRT